jgi:hypothetical protein
VLVLFDLTLHQNATGTLDISYEKRFARDNR